MEVQDTYNPIIRCDVGAYGVCIGFKLSTIGTCRPVGTILQDAWGL